MRHLKIPEIPPPQPDKQSGVNGFLITAACSTEYYKAAINCAQSILDFFPEAKIMICTEHALFQEEHRYLFDVVDLSSPRHMRGKLYALDRSPYDITAYIDADCEIRHDDISTIFDQLGDSDIMMTRIRNYSGAQIAINKYDDLTWHCGVFLYNSKPLTRNMMSDWWLEFLYQSTLMASKSSWPWKDDDYHMGRWDQYTFYRLYSSEKYANVKLEVFPGEDARWNFVNNYFETELSNMDNLVIYHYTLNKERRDAGSHY